MKRLSKYADMNIIEVNDEKTPDKISENQTAIIKNIEGDRISRNIKDGSFVIALAIEGKKMTSVELSEFIEKKMTEGVSHITFIIGGSLGISDDVLKKADMKLSFSDMTFPHQLMRVILLEQIYRAQRIMKNEPYHK
ncbi:MAG: 23S rRNA (pseudouridine(1915)-N(3))-methyltransferase RlmH, partial [Firmicutes bacterium]|nr:23S rRNA (pseudouridine(1915)-N(3))-methyltransferase RlmH [Bacillota bacterium]